MGFSKYQTVGEYRSSQDKENVDAKSRASAQTAL